MMWPFVFVLMLFFANFASAWTSDAPADASKMYLTPNEGDVKYFKINERISYKCNTKSIPLINVVELAWYKVVPGSPYPALIKKNHQSEHLQFNQILNKEWNNVKIFCITKFYERDVLYTVNSKKIQLIMQDVNDNGKQVENRNKSPNVSIVEYKNIKHFSDNEDVSFTCKAENIVIDNSVSLYWYRMQPNPYLPVVLKQISRSEELILTITLNKTWDDNSIFCKLVQFDVFDVKKTTAYKSDDIVLKFNETVIFQDVGNSESSRTDRPLTTVLVLSSLGIFIVIFLIITSYLIVKRMRPQKVEVEVYETPSAVTYAKIDLPETNSSESFLYERVPYATIMGTLKAKT